MLCILITQNQINLFFIVEQLKQATYANKDVVVQSKEPKQEIIKVNYKQIALLKESKIEYRQEL